MAMSCEQKAGQNHNVNVANKSFENVSNIKLQEIQTSSNYVYNSTTSASRHELLEYLRAGCSKNRGSIHGRARELSPL